MSYTAAKGRVPGICKVSCRAMREGGRASEMLQHPDSRGCSFVLSERGKANCKYV